jgi:hypothetical protein
LPWQINFEHVSSLSSGTWNFEVDPRFVQNVCTLALIHYICLINIYETVCLFVWWKRIKFIEMHHTDLPNFSRLLQTVFFFLQPYIELVPHTVLSLSLSLSLSLGLGRLFYLSKLLSSLRCGVEKMVVCGF